jgi:hypothetical protein
MLRHLSPERVKPSRVVVIGAGGFVGGAICQRLDLAKIGVRPVGILICWRLTRRQGLEPFCCLVTRSSRRRLGRLAATSIC